MPRISVSAAVAIATVLEDLSTVVIAQSLAMAKSEGRKRIVPRHVLFAVNIAQHETFRNVDIAGAGRPALIHENLTKPKLKKKFWKEACDSNAMVGEDAGFAREVGYNLCSPKKTRKTRSGSTVASKPGTKSKHKELKKSKMVPSTNGEAGTETPSKETSKTSTKTPRRMGSKTGGKTPTRPGGKMSSKMSSKIDKGLSKTI